MASLYENIRQRREELGLSQWELAQKMGYTSRSSISKIESGENDIPQSKIMAFAAALETTPSELMGWDVDKQKTTFAQGEGRPEWAILYEGLSEESKALVDRQIQTLFDLENKSKE